MKLQGKHVLVTGAAKRLGRALSERFLAEGARLTAHYRSSKAEAKELLDKFPKQVGLVQADLTKLKETEAATQAAVDKWGPVDVLVHSASDFFPTPVEKCTEENWDTLIDSNLKSSFFLIQSLLPKMKNPGGVIIGFTDVNTRRTSPNFSPYLASKGGLVVMLRNLAKELAPGIRVNSIAPGAVLLPENYTPEQKERATNRSVMKRLGTPDDVVEAALFLIGNDYLTGIDLAVDGGRELV